MLIHFIIKELNSDKDLMTLQIWFSGMPLHSIWKFISYWYFRYLMVTEMYMVERWERNVIHSAAVVLFCLFWYFNAKYVISGMSEARGFVTQIVF